MKRILLISVVYPPEPVVSAKVSWDIAHQLATIQGNNVSVLSPRPSRPLGYDFKNIVDVNDNVKHIVLDSFVHPKSSFIGRLRESYSFGIKAAEYIRKHKNNIDCIYLVSWPFYATHKLIGEAHKCGIPIVVSITDIYPESMTSRLGIIGKIIEPFLKRIDAKWLHQTNKIFSISEYTQKYLETSRNLKDKVEVVRIWQEDSVFNNVKQAERVSNNEFVFMFCGSLSPAAKVPFVIKAFKKIKNTDIKLRIVGDGSERNECFELAADDARISFDSVTPDQVPLFQAQADVLLLPLAPGVGKTASPSKLVAYLMSAKPVIASIDVDSDAAQIINKANCGLVSPSFDDESLINNMITMYGKRCDELTSLGKNGQEYAKKHLSKEVNLHKACEIIMSVI